MTNEELVRQGTANILLKWWNALCKRKNHKHIYSELADKLTAEELYDKYLRGTEDDE